jgi:hypothetical protein
MNVITLGVTSPRRVIGNVGQSLNGRLRSPVEQRRVKTRMRRAS